MHEAPMDIHDSHVELFGRLLAATRNTTSRSHFCSTLYKSASFSLELAPWLAVFVGSLM